jgi:hypothetical protein
LRGTGAGDDFTRVVSIMHLISMITAVLLGLTLALVRDRLARALFPVESQSLVARDTQAIALSVLGCYFAILGVCRLLSDFQRDWWAVVQVVLGIALFWGSRGLARLWAYNRPGGSDAPERAV